MTATAMDWPAGEWLVGAMGAIVVVAGPLRLLRRVHGQVGWYGHTARGVLYTAAGFFAVRAAVEFDPDEARGIAGTFRELLTQPHGPWIVGFVAAGFLAFGVYCVLLAFHRHIPNEGLFRGHGSGPEHQISQD